MRSNNSHEVRIMRDVHTHHILKNYLSHILISKLMMTAVEALCVKQYVYVCFISCG